MSMARHANPAKTPTIAVARVLRSYGLKQGTDFRVSGEYGPRVDGHAERIGTRVLLISAEANDVVAQHADDIESATSRTGFPFRVSIRYGRVLKDRAYASVKNFGKRVREEAPVAEEQVEVTDRLAEKSAKYVERYGRGAGGVQQLKPATREAAAVMVAGTPRPAFGQSTALYEGLPQKSFGTSLTWACQEAGQTWFFQNTAKSPRYTLRAYRGRVQVPGWYLTGPGVEGDGYMGHSLTQAARTAEDVILAAVMAADIQDALF